MPYKVEMAGKLYPFDEKGYVEWLDFSWIGLGRSMDATISYVRGLEHLGVPPLGAGLDIRGDERNWPHEATIWPSDIPVFLDRYDAFHRLGTGVVRDTPESGLRELTPEEQEWCIEVLSDPRLDQEAIGKALAVERRSIGSLVSRLAYWSQ